MSPQRCVEPRLLVPVPGTPEDSENLVVVFPHAGGSPRQYVGWTRVFRALAGPRGGEPRLLGVTYPLRDHACAAPRAKDLQGLAAEVAGELRRAVAPGELGGVVLAGHSLGAVVAFEVLRELGRVEPSAPLPTLVVSGQVAPEYAGGGSVHLRSDAELIAELARMDRRTAEVLSDPEMARLHLPAIREDYRLIETYRCRGAGDVLQTKIIIIEGDSDSELDGVDVRGWHRWARRVRGPITVPGDHMHHIAREELAYLCALYARRSAATPL